MLEELRLKTGLSLLKNHVLSNASTRHHGYAHTWSGLQSYLFVVVKRRVKLPLGGLSHGTLAASRGLILQSVELKYLQVCFERTYLELYVALTRE